MARLTIYDPRERALWPRPMRCCRPAALEARAPAARAGTATPPRRILCFRLERIGDLLMTLPALGRAARAGARRRDDRPGRRQLEPTIAAAIPGNRARETSTPRWLAREGTGLEPLGTRPQAAGWRRGATISRSTSSPTSGRNLALAAAGRGAAGFVSGGGGALLDVALDYDASAHTVRTRGGCPRSRSARPCAPVTSGAPQCRRTTARRRPACWPRSRPGRKVGIARERRARDQAVAGDAVPRRGRALVPRSSARDRAHRHAGGSRAGRCSSAPLCRRPRASISSETSIC